MSKRKKPVAIAIWVDGGSYWVFYKSGVNRVYHNNPDIPKKYPNITIMPWL